MSGPTRRHMSRPSARYAASRPRESMKHARCARSPAEGRRSSSTGTQIHDSPDLSPCWANAGPPGSIGLPHTEHVASNAHDPSATSRVAFLAWSGKSRSLPGVETPPPSTSPRAKARYVARRPCAETKHLGCVSSPASGHLSARTDSHTLIGLNRPRRVRTADPLPSTARPHAAQVATTCHDDADTLTFCPALGRTCQSTTRTACSRS
jgi:hypothetical protein